jgi:hypothetical protein
VTILVATETLLLVLLAVLVVGLLRSHAEILRRLGPPDGEGAGASNGGGLPVPRRDEAISARDIAGATLAGEAIQIGLRAGGASTLLAFLSSGCETCVGFWRSLGERGGTVIPGGGRVIAVTKDRSHESPSRLRELAPAGVPLVMSSAAWRDYGVPTTPYFVYVDGASGDIHGEGAATGWQQVLSLLRDALDDVAVTTANERRGTAGSGRLERVARADRELASAGIAPGHPSLYPTRLPGEGEDGDGA